MIRILIKKRVGHKKFQPTQHVEMYLLTLKAQAFLYFLMLDYNF